MALPAGIETVRALAFDVDGTLTRTDNRVWPRTQQALRDAKAAGLEVLVATGRMGVAASDVLRNAGISGYAVACNGAVVEHVGPDELLLCEFMDEGDVDKVLEFGATHDVILLHFGFDRMYALAEHPGVSYINDTGSPVPIVYGPFEETLDRRRVVKTMVHAPKAYLDEIEPELVALLPSTVRSLEDYLEMSHADTNKWTGMKFVLDRLGVDPHEVAGAGDGENDTCWLTQIGFTAAPSNALPSLHDLVQVNLGDRDDDPMVDWIERILAARQQ